MRRSSTPAPSSLGEPDVPSSESQARSDSAGFGAFSQASCGSLCLFFPGLLLLSWFFGFDKKSRDVQRAAARQGRAALAAANHDEVRRISIGFDASVRRTLQNTLDHMADTLAMDTTSDRRRAAGLIAEAFDAAGSGARYFSYQSLRTEGANTESTFVRFTHELAARYQHERGHAPSNLQAHRNEGEGLVVVSVVLATSTAMPPLPQASDPSALRAAVDGLRRIQSPEVLALEVIWSPAEELDRMSSLELEGLYPELLRLDDQAAFGRVSCGYCRAPFPGELGQCPACGAPSTAGSPSG